ncbi:MAG: hypothetical protein IT208_17125 [Chthonomonadales bacterium]|nr:hypothetical protein [Chthonomonadales bacterium]
MLALCALAALGPEGAGDRRRLAPAFQPGPRTYNYAPCLVREPGAPALHAWYCANRTPGDVTDYLCHRKATRVNGRWEWGAEEVALAPAERREAWDSRHACDPEVVAGRFRYRGQDWRYALLYLGCDAERCTHNQVGVAFARSLDGPWTRYPDPIVRYTERPEGGIVDEYIGWPVYRYWGVGQPAALSLDRAGRVLLFFSRGEEEPGEEMAVVDLSDMDRGAVVTERAKVPTAGLWPSAEAGSRSLTNVAVALDEQRGRLYMAREDLPPADGRFPGFIAARSSLASIPWAALRRGEGAWIPIGDVDEPRTLWPRNHNATLARDVWGRVLERDRLTVGVSVAETYAAAPPSFTWLWTYRIVLLDWPTAPSSKPAR